MPGPLLVPDASVLLKWTLRSDNEEHADRALAVRAAWFDGVCDLALPTLWAYEVGNILALKAGSTAPALFRAMLDLEIPEESPAAYSAETFRLVRQHKVTFYDAAYHALAIAKGGTMITADRAYVTKAHAAGHVELLERWHPPRR